MQGNTGSEPNPNSLVEQAFGKPSQDCTEKPNEVPSSSDGLPGLELLGPS